MIDSIQRGTISVSGASSNTATISSVTTSRTVLFYSGMRTSVNDTASEDRLAYVALTSATNIRATRKASSAVSCDTVVQVVEFKAGVINSIQRGVLTIATSASSQSTDLTAVNTANSFMSFLGQAYNGNASATSAPFAAVDLVDADTVRATRGGSPVVTLEVSYELVEFA